MTPRRNDAESRASVEQSERSLSTLSDFEEQTGRKRQASLDEFAGGNTTTDAVDDLSRRVEQNSVLIEQLSDLLDRAIEGIDDLATNGLDDSGDGGPLADGSGEQHIPGYQ